MRRTGRPAPAVEKDPETGRWVLGLNAQPCPFCGAEPVVKYAGNGKAELWHMPVDCCARAKARVKRGKW